MTTLLRAGRLETDDEAAACAGIRKPCIAPMLRRRREMRADGCSFRWPSCPPLGCVKAHHLRRLSKLKPIALFSARDNENHAFCTGQKNFSRILRKCVRGTATATPPRSTRLTYRVPSPLVTTASFRASSARSFFFLLDPCGRHDLSALRQPEP